MVAKIYYHMLILCIIIWQGITETLSEDDIRESSDVLIRKKRVIHHEENGGRTARIENFPYIVNIRQHGRSNCAGTILSHYSVLTAATCVTFHLSAYQVESGSGYSHRGSNHTVTSKTTYYGRPPHGPYDGIALLTIDFPFVFSQTTRSINLHEQNLSEGTQATVSGWGIWHPLSPIRGVKRKLRAMSLPIMDNRVCQRIYRGHFAITNKHICTYSAQGSCAQTDEGAPLVVNNELVGIYVWKGEVVGIANPDVFLNIQNFDYRQWIIQNTILI